MTFTAAADAPQLKESLQAASPRSPEQFGALYDQYAVALYRHVISRVGSRHTAEDITSQVFVKAWEYVQTSAQPLENVRAFLYRIAHNLVADYYRQRKHETVSLESLPEHHRAFSVADGMHRRAEEREMIGEVERALETLDDNLRDVIVWRYVDELSIEEIVIVSGKSANTVYVTLHRALKKLRILLARRGF